MSDVIVVALIVGVTGVITPALLAYLSGRQRQRDKAEDWARQDQVAARVQQVAVTAAETVDKLDDVHKIVNQQRTDMQRYQAVLLAALRRAGVEIPPDESLK
jgi:hypothetical protein